MHDARRQRRQLVAELRAKEMPPTRIADELQRRGVVNPATGRPYALSTIARDVQVAHGMVADVERRQVAEVIGRQAHVLDVPFWAQRGLRTLDKTRPDYRLWDRLRRGLADGFRFGGLLCQPTVEILTEFTFGQGPTLSLVDAANPLDPQDDRAYTNTQLERWMRAVRGLLSRTIEDMYALGDQFVIVNGDGSLSVPSPETVRLEFDRFDYRKLVRATVETRLDDGVVITDVYGADARALTIREGSKPPQTTAFRNLIGRIPVVHFAHARSANELFGRPVYDPLYYAFQRFDILLEKMLDGVELHGNPIPVFEGLEDIQATLDANNTNASESYVDPDGYADTRDLLKWDRNGVILLGKGGKVAMLSPQNGFTGDLIGALKQLFLLTALHVRIPEFMYGELGEGGNRSLSDNQLDVFIRRIQSLRTQLEGTDGDGSADATPQNGILELADLVLRTRRLTDPRITPGPIKAQWPHLTMEEAQITLQKTIYADGRGYLTPSVALGTLNLVPDAEQEVARAQAFPRPSPDADDDFGRMLNTAAHRDMQPSTGSDPMARVPPENPAGGRPGRAALGEIAETLAAVDTAVPDGVDAREVVRRSKREQINRKAAARGFSGTLAEIADKSGVPLRILEQVHQRGLDAARDGEAAEDRAQARVSAFLVGGKSRYTVDQDLWQKVQAFRRKQQKLNQTKDIAA